MRRNLLRPAYGLGRSEFYRAKEATRSFTTTQFFSAPGDSSDKPSNARPNFQQRSERTSKAVNAILKESSANRVARSGPAGATGGPKLINLKSLPRGRGRGNLISLNLMRSNNQTVNSDGASPTFQRTGAPRVPGAFRGQGFNRAPRGGARDGQGRQAGRGGGGAGRRPRKDDGERRNDQDYANRKRGKAKQSETLEQRQERIGREVGVASLYKPTTTLETLVPFLPEVATDSNPLGRLATAMTNMRVLTSGHIDPNPIINAEDMYREYKLKGSMFFTDLRVKKAIEEQVERAKGEIPGPDNVIKETIIKKAILGEYDAIKPAAITDAVTISKNFHLKQGTWQNRQTKAFEAKLVSLVNKARVPRPKPKQDGNTKPQAKAREIKGKASKAKAA